MRAGHISRLPCFLLFAVSAFLLQGCAGGARFVRTAPNPGPVTVRAPEQVVVWRAKPADGRPVVQLGTIEGESRPAPPTGDHSQDALIEIKKEAGRQGCDAILPFAPEERLYATSNGTPLYKVYQTAACFVYVPG